MHQQAGTVVAQTLLAQVQKVLGAALKVAVVGPHTDRARKRQAWVQTQAHWGRAREVMLALVAARLAAVLAAMLRRRQLMQKQTYMPTERSVTVISFVPAKDI